MWEQPITAMFIVQYLSQKQMPQIDSNLLSKDISLCVT